jgi:hypothetical protein
MRFALTVTPVVGDPIVTMWSAFDKLGVTAKARIQNEVQARVVAGGGANSVIDVGGVPIRKGDIAGWLVTEVPDP